MIIIIHHHPLHHDYHHHPLHHDYCTTTSQQESANHLPLQLLFCDCVRETFLRRGGRFVKEDLRSNKKRGGKYQNIKENIEMPTWVLAFIFGVWVPMLFDLFGCRFNTEYNTFNFEMASTPGQSFDRFQGVVSRVLLQCRRRRRGVCCR